MRTVAFALIALAQLLGGCTISHRYSTDSVRTVPALQQAPMAVPAVLDARANGRPSAKPTMPGKPRQQEMTEVRKAVSEHVTRAGIRRVLEPHAPTTAEEMRAVMSQAHRAGVEEVMFVRYHGGVPAEDCRYFAGVALIGVVPWLVLNSVPLSHESAHAGFEAFVVSSKSGELLASSSRLAANGEAVSQWKCGAENILHEQMRKSLHAVLEDIAQQRQAGYPRRTTVPDVAELVVAAPRVRMQGSALRGFGWSIPLDASWQLKADLLPEGGAVSPTGTAIAAQTGWCLRNWRGCGSAHVAQLEQAGATIVSETELEDRRATDIRAQMPDGERVYQRVVAVPGLAFSMTCRFAPDAPQGDYEACRRAFDGARLSVLAREEG